MWVDPILLNALDTWVRAFLPTILTVQTLLQVYFAKKAAKKAAQVKDELLVAGEVQKHKISDVKETLAFETKVQNKKLDEIHKFVNGSYGLALRTAALALKRIAALTNSVLDLEAAKEATDAADAHDFRQVEFDAELNELKRQSDIAKADAKAAKIKAV